MGMWSLHMMLGIRLVLAALGAQGHAEGVTGAEVDLQAIVAQVVSAQAEIRTVQCTWWSRKVYPQGDYLPDQDREVVTSVTLLIDGQKVRHDMAGTGWHADLNKFVPSRESGVLVDGESRYHSATTQGGHIGPWSITGGLLEFYPVYFACRLFDPVLGKATPSAVRFVGRAEYHGHPCIVIEETEENDDYHRWWLAEDQGYFPVLWRLADGEGTLRYQASMEYEKDQEGHWLLHSWDVVAIRNGTVVDSSSNVATEMRLNEPVDPKAFDLVFPPGTSVTDMFRDTRYVVGEQEDVPQEDGLGDEGTDKFVERLRKQHLPAERPQAERAGPVAEQPKAPVAPPVEAVAPPRRLSLPHWLLIGSGVLLLTVAVAAAIRRRRAAG